MSSSNIYSRRTRSGFTLTELLIAIAIIGLLVGLLIAAGSRVIITAREFAVNAEIVQMSQSIENFRTKYGFYPPSFEQFSRNTDTSSSQGVSIEVAQILPFLNKIAPNHQETPARLANWWTTVGVNLDQRSSIVFWLSGLANNKQFPLTNPATGEPLAAFDDGTVEREVFYDFDDDRLREVLNVNDSGAFLPNVRGYEMEFGKSNGELLFVYRDAGSYEPRIYGPPSNTSLNRLPYMRNPTSTNSASARLSLAYHFYNPGSPGANPAPSDYINPDTFQLICFGLDGDGGEPQNSDGSVNLELRGAVLERGGNTPLQGPPANDNLCNFAGGRLEQFVDDQL